MARLLRLAAALRRWLTNRRLAQLAIIVELAVVARVLGEIYRLRAVNGAEFILEAAMVWVTAALVALAFLAVSVALYFAGRDRLAGLAAIVMVVVLIAYKASNMFLFFNFLNGFG